MQSASSRIWTRVTVSISYDDNHHTTGTSRKINRNHSIIGLKTKESMTKTCKELVDHKWIIRGPHVSLTELKYFDERRQEYRQELDINLKGTLFFYVGSFVAGQQTSKGSEKIQIILHLWAKNTLPTFICRLQQMNPPYIYTYIYIHEGHSNPHTHVHNIKALFNYPRTF